MLRADAAQLQQTCNTPTGHIVDITPRSKESTMTHVLICSLSLLALLGCDSPDVPASHTAASQHSVDRKASSSATLVRYVLSGPLSKADAVLSDAKAESDDPKQDIQDCLDNNDNFSSCGSCCVDAFSTDYGLMELCILECRDQCPDEDPEGACPELADSYEACGSCCLGGLSDDDDAQGDCLETCDDTCFDDDCGDILIGG